MDDSVDVFTTVRQLQTRRPEFCSTPVQYPFYLLWLFSFHSVKCIVKLRSVAECSSYYSYFCKSANQNVTISHVQVITFHFICFLFPLQGEYLLVYRALHDYIGTISEKIYENLWKKPNNTSTCWQEHASQMYILTLCLEISNLYKLSDIFLFL